MTLKPLDDRIVVKPNEAEERTASGLVIPDTAKEKPQQGTVLAVGPGRRSDQTGQLIPLGPCRRRRRGLPAGTRSVSFACWMAIKKRWNVRELVHQIEAAAFGGRG